MNTSVNGPIIYVEDDEDDQDLFKTAVTQLDIPNKLVMFNGGHAFIDYICITKEKPLVIVCDINMPLMNGLELRRNIIKDDYLRKKSIPFVFYTTGVSDETIKLAYELVVQGFFEKANKVAEINSLVKSIVEYWMTCKHPNN